MEILALYTSPDQLQTALAAGARHLAGTVQGFALVYTIDSSPGEPDGWAGFTCAKDAQTAGEALVELWNELKNADRPLRGEAPSQPPRVWERAAGGVYGFPLRHDGHNRGIAVIGCPGPWPRMLNADIESTLRQITLVLDHHAVSRRPSAEEPSDELLRLSEQLLAQDIELIKQEERLGQVERLKSDLIEKMSFELRAPLNSIIERVISVLANEHESLTEAARGSLRGVLDDGNALMRTLQNILDLWRLKQGEVAIQLQDINLAEVVEEAIFNVRDSLADEVVLEKRLPNNLPKVRTDLAKLNQILFHLLDNASKFTHRGRISLELGVDKTQLNCSVTDTGIGIAPDDQPEIWAEFYQVDGSPHSAQRGAGLGLTLTQLLVELLGGTIQVSSEIGHGSRFTFSLPVSVL